MVIVLTVVISMKYSFSIILLFLLGLVVLAGSARAAVPDGTRISSESVASLVAWVERATKVQIPEAPIVTASGKILKTALGLEGVQAARSIAAYLPGQIIINNIVWDPESPTAQSYLVHELVHHAQLLSGKSYPCHDAKEREAYTLQNRWLVEHGESPIVTEGWIDRMSQCG
jgi:hypothetical protein